jgi:hypothetical protein
MKCEQTVLLRPLFTAVRAVFGEEMKSRKAEETKGGAG